MRIIQHRQKGFSAIGLARQGLENSNLGPRSSYTGSGLVKYGHGNLVVIAVEELSLVAGGPPKILLSTGQLVDRMQERNETRARNRNAPRHEGKVGQSEFIIKHGRKEAYSGYGSSGVSS